MSSECVSTLEQALSDSEARHLKTQKQMQLLADSLQQMQQQQLLQQPIALPAPSPKNSNNTPQNPISQAPLPALPSEFDGDCSKGQAFLYSCQTYILLCLESFSNNQMKIIWALSHMKSGRAAKWAACIFRWEEENEGYTKFLDWDDFKSDYQRTQSVDDYLNEFLDLVMESRYTDPKTLVVKFRKGLDPQIKNAGATMTNRCPSNIALTAWYEAARNIHKFGSITLNKREAQFSQPKRELFGLKHALEASKYLLIGCRKLVVETDAKYIYGMLNHPEMGPNATINRWIEKIMMFHFELRHVAGKSFGPDGLSRRGPQEGDEVYPPDDDHAEINAPPKLEITEGSDPPLEFDDFKNDIDTRGGYVQQLAQSVECFKTEMERAKTQSVEEHVALEKCLADEASDMSKERCVFLQYTNQYLLPDKDEENEVENTEVYPEEHRTKEGKLQDERLPLIRQWLKDPLQRPSNLDDRQFRNLVRALAQFFLTKEGRLYRRGLDSAHKLVVEKDKRMYMMKAAHDNLGHRGFYATKTMVAERFWWPELERDVSWYCKTCHICQMRQKLLVKIPPVVTHTPSIFQVLHADMMHMSPKSNGCSYIIHGRCGMTSWMEGRPVRQENARTIGMWLF